jgi:hypothetical protein
MVRVTRPGGRIVVREGLPSTHSFFGSDIHASRALTDAFVRQLRNGWIALQMPQLFRGAGLTDLTVEPSTLSSMSLQAVMARVPYRGAVDRALQEGTMEADHMNAWWRSLEEADRAGTFFWSRTIFTFAGRRL